MKRPSELRVEVPPGSTTTALVYPAERTGAPGPSLARAGATLILAHGAGAGQHSPFIAGFAGGLAALGVDVVTFNFLYTEQKRRLPDRAPVLEACYRAVVEAARAGVETARDRLFIGGKSMGGRIATQVAAADRQTPIVGLVLLGYPLHPPGRPEHRRDAHLPEVKRRMLFVQGSRDTFGTPAELSPILSALDPQGTLHTVDGSDHSFKLSRADAKAQAAVYSDVQKAIVQWIGASTADFIT